MKTAPMLLPILLLLVTPIAREQETVHVASFAQCRADADAWGDSEWATSWGGTTWCRSSIRKTTKPNAESAVASDFDVPGTGVGGCKERGVRISVLIHHRSPPSGFRARVRFPLHVPECFWMRRGIRP